jgi:hypothetical protein
MTTQLEDTVQQVVKSFMDSETLFTALDVSNKVKETLPNARHREVRDIVRTLFLTQLQPFGWARTDITVTLEDGTAQTAMLYYPLTQSWDLDTLYDNQKRSQKSVKPSPTALPVFPSFLAPAQPTAFPSTVAQPVSAPPVSAHDRWKGFFQSRPSLFPRKP